jgi:hypothetical protein
VSALRVTVLIGEFSDVSGLDVRLRLVPLEHRGDFDTRARSRHAIAPATMAWHGSGAASPWKMITSSAAGMTTGR